MDDDTMREAFEASRSLAEAEQAAEELPPIVEGEWTTCATCENATGLYKQLHDGALVPICGACMVKEMDEYAEHQRK